MEMETPPRSPTNSQQSECGDTVTISMGSQATSSVHYKRYGAGSDKTDETDIESLSPTSKVVSPPPRGFSPSGRSQSPPQPTSPSTSPRSRSRSRSRSPPPAKLAQGLSSFTLGTPPSRKAPTETFAKMQRDQPRRIAEYNRRSLIDDDEDGESLNVSAFLPPEQVAPPSQTPTPSSDHHKIHTHPPMVKQKTEPALKYKPFQQVEPLSVLGMISAGLCSGMYIDILSCPSPCPVTLLVYILYHFCQILSC